MTANQIIIPLALLFLAAWVVFLAVQSRRITRANAQREHRPNAPNTGVDKADIARSAMSGMMGNDR
ncbi:hypothetical protein Q4555_02190 [Octadecabacter sp. 1_MG-2023]|uniref:hypothetical protein n=1 Tax=unclassified Octadecabacter TaxID=196158 RepID=UPI001C0A4DE6|nr:MULTISPECIES: hypothetical protein [unclassified Octadecabacter]MBU2993089.1 hypothetical protein [Octadecabacter sp. B2R22]MDO6733459.1 hypothetical protein [Octadecabacter sp. 1_MG-2023]